LGILVKQIKLQLPAETANLGPSVGPALEAASMNIMGFCKEFNARTKTMAGMIIGAVTSVHANRSCTVQLTSPPASVLSQKAAWIAKRSGVPNCTKVGKVTCKRLEEIEETKRANLNAEDLDAEMSIIKETARSMGIEIGV
jgi:large subunit ribosomal protein L11